MSENWKIHSTHHFTSASCPKHQNQMAELQNGWFCNPVWWCSECKYPYELEFVKMRKWNQEEVDRQLEGIKNKK